MTDEKKLPDDALDAVSGGMDWSQPQFRGPVTENASPDQANGQLAVDSHIKPQP